MSYLNRLRAKLAEPYEGFEGSPAGHVSRKIAPTLTSEGFEGGESGRISPSEQPKSPLFSSIEESSFKNQFFCEKKPSSPGRGSTPTAQQTRLPQVPPKPSKVLPRQSNPFSCFVCGQLFSIADALVAVLTPRAAEHHWLHHGCHDEHIRRCMAESEDVGG